MQRNVLGIKESGQRKLVKLNKNFFQKLLFTLYIKQVLVIFYGSQFLQIKKPTACTRLHVWDYE